MKHLKTYESIDKPQIGDYVIPNFDFHSKDWENYINSLIGQIVSEHNHGAYFMTKFLVADEIYHKEIEGEIENEELIYREGENRFINIRLSLRNITHFDNSIEKLKIKKTIADFKI